MSNAAKNDRNEANGAPKKYELPSLKPGGQDAATKSNAIEIPQISLPKGGGALKGIDEKFQVNAANGTASFSIPLPLSPGRNGFQPSLALSYNSGAGNSLFGVGWDLGYPSIQRKTDKKLPRYRDYEDSDTFMFSGVEDLVPVLDSKNNWAIDEFKKGNGNYTIRRYRPRIEGGFSRIERITNDKGEMWWKVTTRDNVVTYFGKSESHRIANAADKSQVFKWLPELSFDDKGNCMVFGFKDENLDGVEKDVHEANRHLGLAKFVNKHLKWVKYGNILPFYPNYVTNPADYDAIYDTSAPGGEFLFQAVFDYGDHDRDNPTLEGATAAGLPIWPAAARPDAFSDYRAGFEIRTYRQCRRVLMFHRFTKNDFWQTGGDDRIDYLVRSMSFAYQHATADPGNRLELSYLVGITQTGHVQEKENGARHEKPLPPLAFEYQELQWNKSIADVTPENLANAPVGLSSGYQFTDFYGEGISGILTEQGDGWYYKDNLGGGEFTIARPIMPKPSFTGLSNGVLLLQDLGADGSKQIVVNSPGLQGYFELDDDNIWEPFRTFARLANVDLRDPNTKMFDLNGDGQPDIVISEENVFTWYPSAGRQGYDCPEVAPKPYDEEQGPAIVFADSTQSIFLADMSGDGLTDIVRIRNAEVCYWPNLGYGRFGAKVNMSDAPRFDTPDQFNPAYLQLADISGTGLTDIIYLGKNQFRAWLNLSGNRWSTVTEIDPFPQTAQPAQISVTDLLGNGTACIVWSSPLPGHSSAPMRYIDLMGGVKPHIMKTQRNGMGKVTTVHYKSSIHFYLADKKAGKPWITKLPFPVQCVTTVEIEDKVAGLKFANTYSYHHGYYDHAEREFRGFGRVDQRDTEDYDLDILDETKKLWQPPVLTRTWFHTGAFFRKDKILHQFEEEYWYNDPLFIGAPISQEHRLPDALVKASKEYAAAHAAAPDMEDIFTAQDYREAARACKGMTLRQEVFAQDAEYQIKREKQLKNYKDSDLQFLQFIDEANLLQKTPYSAATHNCHIMALQPRGKQLYAVFMPLESEAITYHYERNTEAPRIAHSINLEVDELGNVLKSVAIAYGRRGNAGALPASVTGVTVNDGSGKTLGERLDSGQKAEHLVFTVAKFTDETKAVNEYAWRLRMPCETKTFELKGAVKTEGNYYRPEDFGNFVNSLNVTERRYEEAFLGGKEKRLIEHVKTLFLKDDLTGALPFGEHGRLGLPFESYQLAFNSDLEAPFNVVPPPKKASLLKMLYDDRVDAGMLALAGYQKEVSGNMEWWWIRSGQMHYPANAAAHFYMPDTYEDPLGSVTRVEVEPKYHLYLQKITDAIGNVTEIENRWFDFRTLAPRRMKDLNGNESEVATDALGLVVAVALRGKTIDLVTDQSESGDHLKNYKTILTDAELDAFKADPKATAAALLGNATTRMIYDFRQKPVWVATIAREKHAGKLAIGEALKTQVSFEYTGGLGQVLLKKVQAEPGDAYQITRNAAGECIKPPIVPANPRWVGNGRTILNNKGNPVKQYEPYFSDTHAYEDEDCVRQIGVTPILHYDPVGRVIRTDMPDGTLMKVEFTTWEQLSYDQNDTVLDSDWYKSIIGDLSPGDQFYTPWYGTIKGDPDPNRVQRAKDAAQKTAVHAGTPAQVFLDTLGRPFFSLADNGANQWYATWVDLDIKGNQRKVTDARGNIVMAWKYDMLGHQLYQNSMDGGERLMLNDCMGKPFRKWNSKGQIFETEYDVLHRPLSNKISVNGITSVFEKILYGTAADKGANLNGQIKEHHDTAGLVKNIFFDFKGNLLESQKTLLADPQLFPNWNINPDFSGDIFRTATEYDALNRPLKYTPPYLSTQPASVIFPKYNEAGLLEKVLVKVRAKPIEEYVSAIEYDAKGQRIFIGYGNKTQTRYTYDPFTFRLSRLHTVRPTGVNDSGGLNLGVLLKSLASWLRLSPKDEAVQDLQYSYDPVGNITSIINNAVDTVFFRNKKVDPHCYYTYDAIYRLIRAEGREHLGQTDQPTPPDQFNRYHINLDHRGDGKALGTYVQTYEYDSVGNILKMHHSNRADAAKSWTRQYQYATGSNQLKGTEITNQDPQDRYTNAPTLSDQFTYDVHGNMEGIGGGYNFTWDVLDRLQCISLPNHEKAWYQYDGSGERTRKVISDALGMIKEEHLYLGGFELYRNFKKVIVRESLHIMDDTRRIALVETKTTGAVNNDSPDAINETLIRYQLSNHLGSAALELDKDARVISYEEYHPYGTTSLQLINKNIKAAAKRYRYSGMERDEESGLNYHSARYYAGWLGRWASADPTGSKGGLNLYVYSYNNPIILVDNNGKKPRLTIWLLTGGDKWETSNEHLQDVTKDMRSGDTNFNTAAGYGALVGIVRVFENSFYMGYDLVRTFDDDFKDNSFVDSVRAFQRDGASVIVNSIGEQVKNVLEGDAVAFGELAFTAYSIAESGANVKTPLKPLSFEVPVLASGGRLAVQSISISVPVIENSLSLAVGGSLLLMSSNGSSNLKDSPKQSTKPPEVDVVEVKPVGRESRAFSQLKKPQYSSQSAIGPGSKGGGLVGAATYDRITGAVELTIRRIIGPGQWGDIIWKGPLKPLGSSELGQIWKESGGDLGNFGRIVEEKIRLRISEATGQPMYNPGKVGAAPGPDFLPQQLPLPLH